MIRILWNYASHLLSHDHKKCLVSTSGINRPFFFSKGKMLTNHHNLPLIILISLRANLQLIWSWKLIFFIATCLSHSLSIPANTSPLAPYPIGRRSVNLEPTLKLVMNWVLMLRGSLLGAAILTNKYRLVKFHLPSFSTIYWKVQLYMWRIEVWMEYTTNETKIVHRDLYSNWPEREYMIYLMYSMQGQLGLMYVGISFCVATTRRERFNGKWALICFESIIIDRCSSRLYHEPVSSWL